MPIELLIEKLQNFAQKHPGVEVAIPDPMEDGFIEIEKVELMDDDGEDFIVIS